MLRVKSGFHKTYFYCLEDKMKGLFKQKLFICAIVAFAISMVCLVISSVSAPSDRLASRFGTAIENADAKMLASCFAPDHQQDAETLSSYLFSEDAVDLLNAFSEKQVDFKKISREVLTGERYRNDDSTYSIGVSIITSYNGEISSVEETVLDIIKVDGKEYISY